MVREPFNLRMEEIEQLDRYTVNRIYFRPRDEKGELVVRQKTKWDADSPKSYFKHRARMYTTLADDQIEKLWQEQQKAEKCEK